ncbi:multiple sugar transport system substrate-binding protein [Catenulispora sp. EB89]|uniref:ABC transporter substrate-binding protein n=1 Tax=Catenulispora sp. EB89 TaxID=3156257 RepID=UPI003516ED36
MGKSRGGAGIVGRRAIGLAAAVLAVVPLAACGGSTSPAAARGGSVGGASGGASGGTSGSAASGAGCAAGATPLTFWSWTTGYDLAVAEFNKTHPDVCVQLQNAGATTAEYVKLNDALKAHTGAPDVATIEYFELPSFEITHSLVDLSQYGVGSSQQDIAPVAWSQVSQGSAVYAMPVDLGPLALYYNEKQLTGAGVPVPTTWAQFADAADKLHAADPKAAITNFDPADIQPVLALMQQYNAFPFTYSGGDSLGVNFTGPAQTAFANYWQGLIDKHEVTTAADFSPAQWSNLDSGANAARLSPAWGPVGMQLSIKQTVGDWRAAPLPQLQAGQSMSGNWGGSSLAVIAGSKHAKAAAEFVQWFGGSADAWKILSGPVAGAFPGYLPLLNSPALQDATLPISGSSKPNAVFATAAQNMTAAQWPPIMTAAATQWTSTFAGVTKGTETLPRAFQTFQQQMVKYAKDQGFKVTGS